MAITSECNDIGSATTLAPLRPISAKRLPFSNFQSLGFWSHLFFPRPYDGRFPSAIVTDSAAAAHPKILSCRSITMMKGERAPLPAHGAPSGRGLALLPSSCSISASISAPKRATNALSQNQRSKITGAASDP
jgi:hypothetical protein